ncbi:hypothetical protein ACFSYH_04050 [Populibacterium corticicola]|uniref:Uncharacterized protein n=1 Tax=Populibacterium corticicola TaxID=1812826 RepID=A0ABW5XEM7_9MICO
MSQPKEPEAPTTSSIDVTQSPQPQTEPTEDPSNSAELEETPEPTAAPIAFDRLNDPELLQFVEDSVYATLDAELQSDDYVIEHVVASHVSKEYFEELGYNSQENIYFGYKLSDVEAQFEGTKYVFDVNEEGVTEVREFAAYDDTFDRVIQNVAIGTGVILVSVAVTVVAGAGLIPAGGVVQAIFAASAKTGSIFALSGGVLGAATDGIITGIQTGDLNSSLRAAAVSGSDGFKWGAVGGVVTGGISKALTIHKAVKSAIPTPRQSELNALKEYGGVEQKSYLAGKEVPYGTPGSTRPDIVRTVNGKLEAIEVKNYDLETNLDGLALKLRTQVAERKANLPEGTAQRIYLDASKRGYSQVKIDDTVRFLKSKLDSIDPNVVIDFKR